MEIVKPRRIYVLILALLILACMPMIWADLVRRWDREFTGNTFWFEYMDFEGFVCQDWDNYQSKTEQLTLSGSYSTMITVYISDYDPLLDIRYTSSASGAVLTASGQYLTLYWADTKKITHEAGDPFDIPCNGDPFAIDKSEMYWKDPAVINSIGKALRITFGVDDSGITETQDGDYTFDVSIGIGYELEEPTT